MWVPLPCGWANASWLLYFKNTVFVTWCALLHLVSTPIYRDVIMSAMVSEITDVFAVCSTVYSEADQRKHPKLRVSGLCEGNPPVTGGSPHNWPVTRKMLPFNDFLIMIMQMSFPLFFIRGWLIHGDRAAVSFVLEIRSLMHSPRKGPVMHSKQL